MVPSMLSMARCWQVMRVLQAHLDGEVDVETATWVSTHLEECRRCGMEAATYQSIKLALAERIDDPTGHGAVPVDPAVLRRLERFAASLSEGGATTG